ncbi:unnamed protein product [Thlaspi arvense]|uniref:PUM-HD domain-containing protein n=1 Tax=Thlaspi arvense TaxID=13288 RepID=A0AAU9R7H5_THLAR|nr:unnamed protein product [Thlaspi arvense]
MFGENFMGFGGFPGDFNMRRADPDRRLPPDFGSSDGFLQSLDTNPFLKNHCYNKSDMVSDGLDLCKKLSKMGIACDMSIWSRPEPIRVDPGDFGSRGNHLREFSSGFEQNLSGASRIQNGFRNASSGFLQNTSHGVSPVELRFLGVQGSVNPHEFEEMMALKNHRDFHLDHMNRPMKRPSPCLRAVCLGNDAFQGPLMFEEERVSRNLAAMEASTELGNDALMFKGERVSRNLAAMEASYTEDILRARGVSFGNDALMFEEERVSRNLAAMEASYTEDILRARGVSFGNDALMFEGKRVSRALAAMEASGASHPLVSLGNDELMFEGNRVSRARAAMEVPGASLMGPRSTNGLPQSLASMVNIYGSVKLMAKDQVGCRVLQKLVGEGRFLDVIFTEIINHVVGLSMDPFGNYIVQKLLDACDEEQRTIIVSVLTSNSRELIEICLSNYGTRVVQKMIEAVKTRQQIGMVKSGLKPGFLALVIDLNGNHVIQTCLNSLSANDNKFVLEAATKYCAEIAVHRHGCCVLQCCVSKSVGEQRERLVNEISKHSLYLSQNPFGNYVVQYLIKQNVSAVKLLVQFRMHYAELATQKFSSHVMEKCLRKYPQSRAEIVGELLSVPNFEHLLQDPYGNYVIQTALTVTKVGSKIKTYTLYTTESF